MSQMLIEEAFRGMLAGNDAVKAMFAARIYPRRIPQYERGKNLYPAVVYELVGRERGQTHDGPAGLVRSHYGVYMLGQSYLDAKRAAQTIFLAGHGKASQLAAIYGDHVRAIFVNDEFDDDEQFDKVEELTLARVTQHWEILHREAIDG